MATQTANYNLIRPNLGDKYDVAVHNNNMDIIDTGLAIIDNRLTTMNNSLSSTSSTLGDVTDLLTEEKTVVGAINEMQVDTSDNMRRINDSLFHTIVKEDRDAFGIFVTVLLYRSDNTLYMKSFLSGSVSPIYSTRTETYYLDDGITVECTKVYTRTYGPDNVLISEVLS